MTCKLLAATLVLVFAGCASRSDTSCCATPSTAVGESQPVTVVDSLAPIKAEFNARADRPRALLLVSPACSECYFGAEVVRTSIMDRFSRSGVYAIVVWQPMLPPDDEDAARRASGIFAGVPATQFYDADRLAGWAYEREHYSDKWDQVESTLPPDHWLRERAASKPAPSPEWDIYMLFRPGVRWEGQSPTPDAFIRHIGRDEDGQSCYWRDHFNAPPSKGDLHQAMEQMGRDVLGDMQVLNIELLGFPGCPNTPTLRQHLREASASISETMAFTDVNQESLPSSDLRRGWPTPTILVNGRDLFGMPTPTSPSMGCRMYPGGMPDASDIARRLRRWSESDERTAAARPGH